MTIMRQQIYVGNGIQIIWGFTTYSTFLANRFQKKKTILAIRVEEENIVVWFDTSKKDI